MVVKNMEPAMRASLRAAPTMPRNTSDRCKHTCPWNYGHDKPTFVAGNNAGSWVFLRTGPYRLAMIVDQQAISSKNISIDSLHLKIGVLLALDSFAIY